MKITFYIPALNAEKTIRKTIGSILKLGVSPEQIKIINGKSTDNTVNVTRKLGARILELRENNLAGARNLALQACRTEFIAFVDADCVPDRMWLRKIMKNFDRETIVGACGKLIEKNKEKLPDRWRAFHLKQHWGNKKIKNPDFLFGANCVFRAGALKKAGGYDEKYRTNYEDVDMSRTLKKKGFDIIYEPEAVCYHLKQDDFRSIIETARKWSFYSYPVPDSLTRLILRLIICNPHIALNFTMKELLKLKPDLTIITLFGFLYNQFYDLRYYLGLFKRHNNA